MTVTVKDLLAYAEQQLGKPYVWGAAGPDHFDCSGYTQYVFRKFGISLPHHAQDQASFGQSVPKNKIQAGDLVFSDWGDGPSSHVGIAVSPNEIIDAPHSGANVRYDKLSSGYLSHVTAVRRMPEVTGGGSELAILTGGGGGGGTGGFGSGTDVGTQLESTFAGLFNDVKQVFTGPYQELAKPLQDAGSAALEFASIGDKVMRLFMPSNFLRLIAGVWGAVFVLIGIWFLSREIR